MKRRHFVIGSVGIVGALTVGWTLLPPRQRLTTSQPLPLAAGEAALNGFLKIGADGALVVVMPRSEMGQGAHTGLAMLLADELDADWSTVRIEASPIDAIYNNIATLVDGLPFHPDDDGAFKRFVGWMAAKSMREVGVMMTGGSSSIKDLWLPMREAGASARSMLVDAAASRWGVQAADVVVDSGRLRHLASGRELHFGEVSAAAGALSLPSSPTLKTPAQFKLIGRPVKRIEAASKADGSAGFGLDVVQPGMLYATVRMCPTLGGKVASFDGAAARARRGVKQVLAVPAHAGGTGGVAVIADSPWRALQAVDDLVVTWDEAVPAAGFSSAAAIDALARQLDDADDGYAFFSHGDADAAMSAAARVIDAEYRAPWLAHAAMEPMNCTVLVDGSRATVWAPTQVPGLARRAAAVALDISDADIEVRVTLLGGGFGRRLDVDFVGQAAAIAKQTPGTPVMTFWSREEDTRHDFYRPACVSRMKAGFDAQGRLVAWKAASAGQSILHQVLQRQFGVPGAGPDKTAAEGAFDQPYEWPAARIAHRVVDLPVPVGFWRSVGHSHQAFFKESFVDEAAHAAGVDPVEFRAGLLQRHPRHLAVLRRAAALAGWGQPPAAAADGAKTARGVALHQSFGSIVAQVAEVSLSADRTIRVHRVVCVVDCGMPVNPNLIRQQMESGIVFGLGAALGGEITITNGRVAEGNFDGVRPLRLDACPVIETEIIAGDSHPEGIGEPGTPPIAPAVANALFALTGQRLRSLPLKL